MENDKRSSSASKDDHAKSDIKDILKSKLTQQQRDELKQKLKIQQPPELQNPRSAPGSNAVVRNVPPKIPKREPILLINESAKSNKQPYSKAMVFGILFASAISVYWIYKILIVYTKVHLVINKTIILLLEKTDSILSIIHEGIYPVP